MTELTDTDKKIRANDHDILIAVHTLLQEHMRRLDDYIKSDGDKHAQTAVDIKGLSIEQARVGTELIGVKQDVGDLNKRMDNLENKSVRMDLIAYVGAVIAGIIAWFK